MRLLAIALLAGVVTAQAPTVQVKNEQPGGAVDGVRQFFTLKHRPVKWTVQLYKNGIRQFIGQDFAEDPAGSRIGFFPCCIPKATGDKPDLLLADYEYVP